MLNGYLEVAAYQQHSASSWLDKRSLAPVHRSYMASNFGSLSSTEMTHPYPKLEPWPSETDIISSDFILVTEFCEVTGPKPTITIPSDLRCTLDLNEFAVRILSSDYQGAESGSCLPTDDAQGFLSDVFPSIHAYVHYTTLSDVKSRGYVHPMCIAYVTTDSKKLFDQFENIRNQLLLASSHLKYGSKLLFKKELQDKLEDLLYTKGCYITHSTKSPTTESLLPANSDFHILNILTLEILQSDIEEVESVLIKINQVIAEESSIDERLSSYSLILDKVPVKSFPKSDPANLPELNTLPMHQRQPSLIKPSNFIHDPEPSRNLVELSGEHSVIGLYFLYKAFKMFSKTSLELYLERHHTVLPHMEHIPSTFYPLSAQTDDISFRKSIKFHFHQMTDYLSSEEDLSSSSISSDVSSTDSLSPLYKDTLVLFSSSLEYLNSNLFATIHSLNAHSPGYGISKVLKTYPCGQHILYSLLLSRLLIVLGKPESENQVRKVVQALQPLIIPFSCPALIIPWRKESLKVTDLGRVQLVGLCHSSNQCLASVIPDSMKHYISILDVDQCIFVGPKYSGKFLHIFENDINLIQDDATVLSCINSMIFDVVLKTRIFYYHQLEAESSIQNKRIHGHDEDNDKLFFRQMSNHASDISIIKHLVEVMKNETINKLKSINRHSVKSEGGKSAPVVRIKHDKVSVIKL